jgi:hypothetical protein
MGKGPTWVRDILNGKAGVLLDDLPKLIALLDIKMIDQHKQSIDPEIGRAYEAIVRKAVGSGGSLLFEE